VLIDLLTDSGTGAMSAKQWAALMEGDESYAGSRSFQRLEAARGLTGKKHVIPTHQGRAAEHILFGALVRPGFVVPANCHFDTTRANALDLLRDEALDPDADLPFKGDLDVQKLDRVLRENCGRVPCVIVTVTNNRGGGQPVSLQNLREVRSLTRDHHVRLLLDAARFAENAWLVKQREPGQGHRTARAIAVEQFSLCDGFTLSAKKDGLVNIGGLAGRDLEALAVGLAEVLDEDYLAYRHASIRYIFKHLDSIGAPMVRPPGGHAIYLDAARFLPHVPRSQYPGLALANALYLVGGVRGVEVGTLMFGHPDPKGGPDAPAPLDLLRLTIPRRTYTQSHMDYVIEVVTAVWRARAAVPGYRIVAQRPVLRAFTAELEPLAPQEFAAARVPV
jgi:tryptophanase